MPDDARPPFIVSAQDVPEEPGQYPDDSELLSYGRALGKAAGLKRIGIHLERLPPGHRTSWPHAESEEEEFFYVLAGEVEVWLDGHLHHLVAGDFCGFVAGTGIAHTVINNSSAEATLLAGGERPKEGNRIHYPLHPGQREKRKDWWHDAPRHPLGPHDGKPKPPGK